MAWWWARRQEASPQEQGSESHQIWWVAYIVEGRNDLCLYWWHSTMNPWKGLTTCIQQFNLAICGASCKGAAATLHFPKGSCHSKIKFSSRTSTIFCVQFRPVTAKLTKSRSPWQNQRKQQMLLGKKFDQISWQPLADVCNGVCLKLDRICQKIHGQPSKLFFKKQVWPLFSLKWQSTAWKNSLLSVCDDGSCSFIFGTAKWFNVKMKGDKIRATLEKDDFCWFWWCLSCFSMVIWQWFCGFRLLPCGPSDFHITDAIFRPSFAHPSWEWTVRSEASDGDNAERPCFWLQNRFWLEMFRTLLFSHEFSSSKLCHFSKIMNQKTAQGLLFSSSNVTFDVL